MKKVPAKRGGSEMRAEYDFSNGVRGAVINARFLDPDLAETFPDSKSVNDALRALLAIAVRIAPRKGA